MGARGRYGEKINSFSVLMGCSIQKKKTTGAHRLTLSIILKWVLEKYELLWQE